MSKTKTARTVKRGKFMKVSLNKDITSTTMKRQKERMIYPELSRPLLLMKIRKSYRTKYRDITRNASETTIKGMESSNRSVRR